MDLDFRQLDSSGFELRPLLIAGSVGCSSGSRLRSEFAHRSEAIDIFRCSASSVFILDGYSNNEIRWLKMTLLEKSYRGRLRDRPALAMVSHSVWKHFALPL